MVCFITLTEILKITGQNNKFIDINYINHLIGSTGDY